MPTYTYRREDGTVFEVRQKFLDEPLTVDPDTGQKVVRVVQAAGIIFKGSGFYVNDSKNASRSSINATPKSESAAKAETTTTEAKSDAKEVKSETKTETKAAAAD
ncbi:MAG: zinc ribbon domain-containing protein [Anaerolineae bacterium]|nr:zinc ribbon domain-containing protein [Anaerolineae bacterium]